MISHVLFFFFVVLSLGCVTTEAVVSVGVPKSNLVEKAPEPNTIEGCTETRPACNGGPPAPAYCRAVVLQSAEDDAPLEYFAWGSNRCRAMQSLNIQFCRAHLPNKLRGWLDCRPDAGGGNCPAKFAKKCSQGILPTRCWAALYDTQRFPDELGMRSRGINECEAKKRLHSMACAKNLNPRLIKYIHCEREIPADRARIGKDP
jgi:hypothetical protein